MAMSFSTPVIYGAGAIGGLIGAYALRDGQELLLVDRDAAHVRRMNEAGLHVHGSRGEFSVAATAARPSELPDHLELVLLAVKGQDTVASLDLIVPKLAPDGVIVSLQNGLNEGVIADRIGA